mgnify:CR=1 FL=1
MITKYYSFVNEVLGFKNFKDFILLIGPPGIGKSFYTSKLNKKYDILNRDDIVTEICEEEGLTYKDAFNRPNYVLGDDRNFHAPNESDFYEINGKKYLKNHENLGEIIELPENNYMRRWCNEGFSKVIKINDKVEETFKKRLQTSIKNRNDIIIDMTNINRYSRELVLSKLGENKKYYKVKAVVFNEGGKGMEDIIININKKRDLELLKSKREKNIPEFVLKDYINKYQEPSKDEGFDEIIHVSTKKELENIL